MSRRFIVKVGAEECVCELLEAEAPQVVGAFVAALPLRSFVMHAKYAGEELMAMLPFRVEPENLKPDGNEEDDVAFNGIRQNLCLFYGQATPLSKPGNAFARVVSGKDNMRRVAEQLQRVGRLPVDIFLEGQQPEQGAFSSDAAMTPFSPRARRFLGSIWHSEPTDLERLLAVKRPPTGTMPGVLDAYYNLFIGADLLQHYRSLAEQQELDVPALSIATATLLGRVRNRLSHWQMRDSASFLADAETYFRGESMESSVAQLATDLQDLILILNRLQTWIDSVFPWEDLDASIGAKLQSRIAAWHNVSSEEVTA